MNDVSVDPTLEPTLIPSVEPSVEPSDSVSLNQSELSDSATAEPELSDVSDTTEVTEVTEVIQISDDYGATIHSDLVGIQFLLCAAIAVYVIHNIVRDIFK